MKLKKTKNKARFSPKTQRLGLAFIMVLLCAAAYWLGSNHRMHREALELSQVIKPISGMSVQVVGGTIFLWGELNSIQEYQQARSVANALNSGRQNVRVSSVISLSEPAKNEVLVQLKNQIRNARVKARFVNDRLLLEGTVRDELEADRVVEIAKSVLLLGPQGSLRETAAESTERPGLVILDMLKIRGK